MSVWWILRKNIMWRFHNRFTVVLTILQPVLWLVLYSAVAGQTMRQMGIENYTAFILPGLMVLVSFSTCSSSGMMNYMMKTDGSFYRILIAPVKRSSIILGQLLEAALCTFLEVGIMVIISLCFSVRLFPAGLLPGLGGLAAAALLILLMAIFMSAVACGISLVLPNEMVYETVMNAIVLPVFFLSSALFPMDGIGGGLRILINLNPFTHVINSMRCLILTGGIEGSRVGLPILLLSAMAALAFWFADQRLKRETGL